MNHKFSPLVQLCLQSSPGDGSTTVQLDVAQPGRCRLRVRVSVPPTDSGAPSEVAIQKVRTHICHFMT